MNREEKQTLVDELSEKFQSHNAFYIADASGMSVAKINDFRRLCFNRGLEFKVYKNSFIRKALDTLGGDTAEMDTALKGQSGVLFSKESGSAPRHDRRLRKGPSRMSQKPFPSPFVVKPGTSRSTHGGSRCSALRCAIWGTDLYLTGSLK